MKVNVKVNTLQRRPEDDGEEGKGGPTDEELWAALEEVCQELGYSLEDMVAMLESPDFPPPDVMERVMQRTGGGDKSALREMLRQQRPAVLARVKEAVEEVRRKKTAAEEEALQRVRAMGLCPAGFDWIKIEGGYRCGGGTHFASDADVSNVIE